MRMSEREERDRVSEREREGDMSQMGGERDPNERERVI